MHSRFTQALVNAQGRSEFVIVVVADIRGFSDFSTRNESPNIAMFIKRFYLQLIEKYFPTANFVKPTGDGLLMTFGYSEHDLFSVAADVINACIACLEDFPTICKDDPMINFAVPGSIGFGVARGTACCLYSGDEILDYSGHLLNLSARLNDLARPSGIVVDGLFLKNVIPETIRERFASQQVYLRGIADDQPISVLYLADEVTIPDSALSPLKTDRWLTIDRHFSVSALQKISSRFLVDLSPPAKSKDKINITVMVPKRGKSGLVTYIEFDNFTYEDAGPTARVVLDMDNLRKRVMASRPTLNSKTTIRVAYVGRPLART